MSNVVTTDTLFQRLVAKSSDGHLPIIQWNYDRQCFEFLYDREYASLSIKSLNIKNREIIDEDRNIATEEIQPHYVGTANKTIYYGDGSNLTGVSSDDEKVKYDVDDPTAGYLSDKVIAGDGISVEEGTGADENKLKINNTDKGSDVDLSGLVPYTGANTTVNLGSEDLETTGDITGGNLNIINWDSVYEIITSTGFSGDVTGIYSATKVEKIQNTNVSSAVPTDLQIMRFIAANNRWEPTTVTFTSTYLGLTDTDDTSYAGKAGYIPMVNVTENGLILTQPIQDVTRINRTVKETPDGIITVFTVIDEVYESDSLEFYYNGVNHTSDITETDSSSGTFTVDNFIPETGSEIRCNYRIGISLYGGKKNNVTTTDPTVDDDVDEGYSVGSFWHNTDNLKSFVCLDITDGAAIWKNITGLLGNYSATVDPTADDDSGDGYEVGSIWINVTDDSAFICLDSTLTAAIWFEITQSVPSGVRIDSDSSSSITNFTFIKKNISLPYFEPMKSLPATRKGSVSGKIGNYLYMGMGTIGGSIGSTIARFNLITEVWDTVTPGGSAVAARTYGDGCVYNSKLYFCGGDTSGSWTASAKTDVFDPETGNYANLADMPAARAGNSAVLVQHPTDSKWYIYSAGGMNGSTYYSSLYAYDIVANTWATKTSMNYKKRAAFLVWDGGNYLYSVCGYNGSNRAYLERYDLRNDAGGWTVLKPAPTARRIVTGYFDPTIGLSGSIVTMGGYTTTYLNIIEIYDIYSGEWFYGTNMPIYSSGIGFIIDKDNEISYILGGNAPEGDTAKCLKYYYPVVRFLHERN